MTAIRLGDMREKLIILLLSVSALSSLGCEADPLSEFGSKAEVWADKLQSKPGCSIVYHQYSDGTEIAISNCKQVLDDEGWTTPSDALPLARGFYIYPGGEKVETIESAIEKFREMIGNNKRRRKGMRNESKGSEGIEEARPLS